MKTASIIAYSGAILLGFVFLAIGAKTWNPKRLGADPSTKSVYISSNGKQYAFQVPTPILEHFNAKDLFRILTRYPEIDGQAPDGLFSDHILIIVLAASRVTRAETMNSERDIRRFWDVKAVERSGDFDVYLYQNSRQSKDGQVFVARVDGTTVAFDLQTADSQTVHANRRFAESLEVDYIFPKSDPMDLLAVDRRVLSLLISLQKTK